MKSLHTSLIVGVLLLTLTFRAQAWSVSINDLYVGADDHGYGDLIEDGSTDSFDIFRAEVTRQSAQLTVDIFTEFAGKADDGIFSSLTRNGKGIGYGDLFLSSSWSPNGSAPYSNDNAASGTTWEYVLSLDNRWSSSGGTAWLHRISGNTVRLSDYFMTGGVYRNGQEAALAPSTHSLATGSWSVSDTVSDPFIRFETGLTGTSLAASQGIAFHWGETCANDVIEGYAAVPEPATMLLFGTGLLGLAFIGRRSLKRKADRERS